MPRKISVFAGLRDGKPMRESIPAEKLAGNRYRMLASPGFANEFASGDVIELIDNDGRFRVVQRGGNVCVQIFFRGDKDFAKKEFGRRLAALDGWLDGGTEGKGGNLLIYTIPHTAGFPAIEGAFENLPNHIELDEWMYGNVYADDGAPLNWWQDKA
jgi:hypothetical protein